MLMGLGVLMKLWVRGLPKPRPMLSSWPSISSLMKATMSAQVNGIPEILHGYRSAQLGIKCTGERRQHNKAVAAPEIISDPKLVNPFCLCPLGQIDQLRKRYMGVSGQMELNTDFQCGHIRVLAPG